MGALDHHVRAYGLNVLRGLPERWWQNYEEARADEWRQAIQRGECTAAQAVAGQAAGSRAPLPYSTRASEADEEWQIPHYFCGAPECPISAEMRAGRELHPEAELKRLADGRSGLAFALALWGVRDIVKARCDVSHRRSPRLFAFGGPDGRLVLAVRDADFARIDAVAFRIDDPGGFALLRGAAAFLGEWLVRDRAWSGSGRLRLVRDPLEWIRADGKAVCILDWARAVHSLRALGEGVTIEAPADLAALVRAKMERGGLPLVATASEGDAGQMSLAERLGRGGREAA